MQNFDTDVQKIKYYVLRAIAKSCFNGTLQKDILNIPEQIVPGPKPTNKCCIYKERAIIQERVKLILKSYNEKDNVVSVMPIACDECPTGGYQVTDGCRGCIAHRCMKACIKKAITFDTEKRKAHIDKSKCINCGMCSKVCQYNAITNFQRPCEKACTLHAISMDENEAAKIDDNKCIQCGNCVSQCPFGAIMDKSMIVDVINELKKSDNSKKFPVYAVIAPSIATQFNSVPLGKIITAITKLGFKKTVEAALGADMVSLNESKELSESKFLTSSCCPTFVSLIKNHFPQFKDHISTSLSPMATICKHLKEKHPDCVTVFIGPCIAKKKEMTLPSTKKYVDYVLTFEEINAMIDAKEIDVTSLKESELGSATGFGRGFAKCGGLGEAVKEALKEQKINFEVKPLQVDGLDKCVAALKTFKIDETYNFIEGMACKGGCIGGPACLTHEARDKIEIEEYMKISKTAKLKLTENKLNDERKNFGKK